MKLVLITGGSQGLGKALVRSYLAQQWEVFEYSRTGGGHCHVTVDLSDTDRAMDVIACHFEFLAARPWQRIVFINNAASLGSIAPLHQLSDDDIGHNLNLNFNAGIRVMALFVRKFSAITGDKIVVNISSGAAGRSYEGWALYCAAKAGLDGFVRTLALEQAARPDGIVCINFNPGVFDSEMQSHIRSTPPGLFPSASRFIALHQSGLQSPLAVAQALVGLTTGVPENGRLYQFADMA
jgi:benzil reductase ((S)-benzoin forming)